MPTLPFSSVDELRSAFHQICNGYSGTDGNGSAFTELALRLLALCDEHSVSLLLDAMLRRIAEEPEYRPPGCALAHTHAQLCLDYLTPNQPRPEKASSLAYATVAKLLSGGPASMYVLFPGESTVPGSQYSIDPRVFPYELGTASSPVSLSAGCVRWFEAGTSGLIAEVRSPAIVQYVAELDLSTHRVKSVHLSNRLFARHDLLETALIAMLLPDEQAPRP